ncbi:MAG: hypothetical protein ACREAM_07350 [Blastocatellia bacterium]
MNELSVYRRDERKYILLDDLIISAIKAAFEMGLSGDDAEQTAIALQDEMIDLLAAKGIGILDTDDGQMWIPI